MRYLVLFVTAVYFLFLFKCSWYVRLSYGSANDKIDAESQTKFNYPY